MRRWIFPSLLLVLSGCFLFWETGADAQASNPPLPTQVPTLKLSDPLPANLFIELAKAVNPAVVNISTSQIPRGRQHRDPMLEMLEQFYGVPLTPRSGSGRPRQVGLGTGFVIREDGLIVTNAHVIRGADLINVNFDEKSDKTYEATVVGSDERSDIALLKIKADRKLPTLTMGSSKDLQVGEWVAAFGNPFGHGHTMTKGIISSIGRQIEEINKFPLIQTDTSINPGNSGGPLVNSKGQVIGVNSAIDARAQGIGFAIPIDEVRRILPDLESKGRIRKGYLGVGLTDIYSSEGEESPGVGIVNVEPGGPAAKAGVRLYDTVVEFNGKKVKNTLELMDAVADTTPGSKVNMKVLRGEGRRQNTLNLTVTVAERPDVGARRQAPRESDLPKGQRVPHGLGFSVADLTEDLRSSLGAPEGAKKPVIVAVESSSVAAFVGLRVGDLILEINKTEVSSAADVVKAVKRDSNSIKVARGNQILVLSIGK